MSTDSNYIVFNLEVVLMQSSTENPDENTTVNANHVRYMSPTSIKDHLTIKKTPLMVATTKIDVRIPAPT